MDMTPRESIGFCRLAVACALALIAARPINAIAQPAINQPNAAKLASATSKDANRSKSLQTNTGGDPRNHVIHRFDFTEPDNLNPQPKHWIRFPDPSLPIYPDRQFPRSARYFRDSNMGHVAAPALYIDPAARNAATRYRGVDTAITPGDYVITGWIRPDELTHARAAISAYYLDWQKQPLPATQRFSQLIFGSATESDPWTRVRVELGAAPKDAVAIGVTCWVVQQDVWRENNAEHHHIDLRDVKGGAWFDDIEVHAQPEMRLRFGWAGNVVTLPDRPEFDVLVRDVNPAGLSATLTITNQFGQPLFEVPVGVDSFNHAIRRQRVVTDRLDPGLYTATLNVTESDRPVSHRQMHFAVLQDFASDEAGSAHRLGIVLQCEGADAVNEKLALMDAIGAESAKIPLWPDSASESADLYAAFIPRYLAEFGKRHWSVIGMIATPPPGVRVGREGNTAKLVSLLTDGSGIMREAMAAVVAPYAVMVESWQVGVDGQSVTQYATADLAVNQARMMIEQFVNAPSVGTTAPVGQAPRSDIELETQCVTLDTDVPAEFVINSLAPFLATHAMTSVFVPPPDWSRGDHDKLLNAWALQIIAALSLDVRAVYTAGLWSLRNDDIDPDLQPNRQLIAYRTIARLIGDATPFRRVMLANGVRGFSFRRREQATMVLWRRSADIDTEAVRLQLGRSPRAYDIEGREIPIHFDDRGLAQVPVGPQPIIVTGIEQWLVAMLTDTTLSPDQIEFGYAPTDHQITVSNPTMRPLTGRIQLAAPDGWLIEPTHQQFIIQPGEQWTTQVAIRQAGNETAGVKHIHAEIKLTSSPGYVIPIDLPLRLDAADLDVWAYAIADGEVVVIRQEIMNLSHQPISLQGFAALPGQSRRYRAVNTLKLGDTATFDYRFPTDRDPVGQTVRLGLRRSDGVIVHNLHIKVQ